MAAGEQFIRVGEAGRPSFQLRAGELGISVFDLEAVEPPLTESEVLECFRAESEVVIRSKEAIERAGLTVVPVVGADLLPVRLQAAHAEIRPGPGMTRVQFKRALRSME